MQTFLVFLHSYWVNGWVKIRTAQTVQIIVAKWLIVAVLRLIDTIGRSINIDRRCIDRQWSIMNEWNDGIDGDLYKYDANCSSVCVCSNQFNLCYANAYGTSFAFHRGLIGLCRAKTPGIWMRRRRHWWWSLGGEFAVLYGADLPFGWYKCGAELKATNHIICWPLDDD